MNGEVNASVVAPFSTGVATDDAIAGLKPVIEVSKRRLEQPLVAGNRLEDAFADGRVRRFAVSQLRRDRTPSCSRAEKSVQHSG